MHAPAISPMMSDALVILGAAGIVIPVFARFRITPVIGFILVGLLVGPFGLGRMVYANEWLTWVTITDPEGLEPFVAMMGQYWTGALALGLALALSSTALVLPITGTHTAVGRAALAMLLFEDIAIVPIIFVLGALAPRAGTE